MNMALKVTGANWNVATCIEQFTQALETLDLPGRRAGASGVDVIGNTASQRIYLKIEGLPNTVGVMVTATFDWGTGELVELKLAN